MYTIGETENAIRLFLGLLHGSAPSILPYDMAIQDRSTIEQMNENVDKVYLEDFRDSFQVTSLLCHARYISFKLSLASSFNWGEGHPSRVTATFHFLRC